MPLPKLLKRYVANQEGNFVVTFAMLSIPIALMMGVAVDYGRGSNDRSSMQNALDAAALAVISDSTLSNDTQRQAKLNAVYAGNAGLGTATVIGTDLVDGKFVMKTRAEYDSPLTFMRLGGLGKTSQRIGVNTTVNALQQLDDIALRAIDATGWWDKVVRVMGRKEGTSTYTELGNIKYLWNGIPGTINLGTTSISVRQNNKLKETYKQVCATALLTSCLVTKNANSKIDVTGIDDLYLQMEISASTYKLAKDDIASRPNLPLVIRTNDPALSDRLYVEGVQQPKGQVVDVFKAVNCGEWIAQQWEDGGKFDRTDFSYEVQGYCSFKPGKSVALVN